MFDSIANNLNDAFQSLSGRGRLSEDQVEAGLQEVRRILLAADVHYEVAKDIIKKIKKQALDEQITKTMSPAQQLIQIARNVLEEKIGQGIEELEITQPLTPIILLGLQGTGKTTTCAKLAYHYKEKGKNPLLISTDSQRPAAQEQLKQMAQENNLSIKEHDMDNVKDTLNKVVATAKTGDTNPLIVDTAGRLSIDEPMVKEARKFANLLPNSKRILVLDGMMGQEALEVADEFNDEVDLDGLIMTKMDGDARGGAAISAYHITESPLLFLGTGETVGALEPFYPDRMASRMLGMGDMLSLIDEAEEAADNDQEEMAKRAMEGQLTMDDVLEQFEMLSNMGPLESILERIPGGYNLKEKINNSEFGEKEIEKMKAIIRSMTEKERKNPNLIDGSRRKRIADGSGTSREMVNKLLKQHQKMKNMMDKMGNSPDKLKGVLDDFMPQ